MENSRQNTRFHWRNAKRLEKFSETMDSDGTNVEFGGNVEIDGKVKVNGTESFRDANNRLFIKDLEDSVNGENTVVITFTEDDWDEDNEIYVKHIEINNAFIRLDYRNLTKSLAYLTIYNPYFKALSSLNNVDAFSGLDNIPEDRSVVFDDSLSDNGKFIALFNGIIEEVSPEI